MKNCNQAMKFLKRASIPPPKTIYTTLMKFLTLYLSMTLPKHQIFGMGGILLIFSVLLVGCGEKKVPLTPTSGYITVKGSDQTLPLMMEEAYAFMDLYPKSKILVKGGGSNPALVAVFTDSAQIAVSTRPMNPDELKRAEAAGFNVNEFKIAKDGIAVIVNPLNPVKRLTVDQVQKIFTGRIRNWSAVGGKDWLIQVNIWSENSGTYSFFKDSILKGDEYSDKVWRFDLTEAMVKNIEKEKGAIGIVSMSRLYHSWSPLVEDMRIKALEIGLEQKGKFILPDESTVFSSEYPFIRYIYLYTAKEPKGLDAGFITFITSSAGQKLIAGNGFVPITVPVKYRKESL